jgi:methionyl-tRNA synthetase
MKDKDLTTLFKNAPRVLVGVAWPYVNGDLHPGHITGNFLPADIFARFARLAGKDVAMVSGSDCYGTPITIEAENLGISPSAVVEKYQPGHLELFKLYNINFDLYTKTTTKNHEQVTQEMLVNLANNGYVFKQKTDQYYSVEENKFLPDRYVEGICPFCGFEGARGDQCDNCGKLIDSGQLKSPYSKQTKGKVVLKETEHLFLDWSKLQPFLEKYYTQNSHLWRSWIKKEVGGWLKTGLQPRPITRDIEWGIKIPNQQLPQSLQLANVDNKRIYVWFEAVIGYLSATKELSPHWEKYWHSEDKQSVAMYNFMGKDNVVFHALFWPGQLYGAYGENVKLPNVILANQFLNLEGQKFSKSRGVTIDSLYLAKTYGSDIVRFYLTYIMPENNDSDFSWSDFVDVTNNVLIAKIGNYFNRIFKFATNMKFDKYISSPIAFQKSAEALNNANKYLTLLELKRYVHEIVSLATTANVYIDLRKPWSDNDEKRKKETIQNCVVYGLALMKMLKPLLPDTYEKLSQYLNIDIKYWKVYQNPGEFRKEYDNLSKFIKIDSYEPLFTKIDPEIVELERGKILVRKK